jgi:5-methylthioadenosine/S-adenosylhomocysteine deaminase
LEKRGLTPTEYIGELGLLEQDIIPSHCVHLSESDEKILEQDNAKIARCPSSNLKLGSGIADVRSLKHRGLDVAIATDSSGSNNHLNLFREARMASLLQKREDPKNISPQEALDMVIIDAAKVLGLEDEVGSVEQGKRADLIIVDEEDTGVSPYHGEEGLISNLVYSFDGEAETVLVNGDIVFEGENPTLFKGKEASEETPGRIESITEKYGAHLGI